MKTIPSFFQSFCSPVAARVASRRALHVKIALGLGLAALAFTGVAEARARSIPTPSSQPISITVGPDGNLWFTEQNSSRVARITPQGIITEFQTPDLQFPVRHHPGSRRQRLVLRGFDRADRLYYA